MGKATRYIILSLVVAVAACRTRDATPRKGSRPDRYEIGKVATAQEIAALDVDINPTGAGLPPGQGTAATGAMVYAAKCAACHGPRGEGIEKNPRLVGKEPPPGFAFATDVKAPKTIGNYWPYATTLYDYIRRAMPLTAPGSLTSDETYGVIAYLLAENGVIPASTVMDAHSLPQVKMPAQRYFVKDNRTGGAEFK